MKKKQINVEQLSLDKETIARLNEEHMNQIAGGAGTLSCKQDEQDNNEMLPQSCCLNSCNTVSC